MNKYFTSFLFGGALCACGYGLYRYCETEEGGTKMKKILGATIVAAIGAIGYSLYNSSRMDNLLDRLDVASSDLSRDVVLDISDSIVSDAVRKSVDKAVSSKMNAIENDVIRETSKEIRDIVGKAVTDQKAELKDKVKHEMLRQTRYIDTDSIKEELTDQLKEELTEKLKEDTDELLDSYKEHFDNMADVYDAVSKVIASRV